VEEKRSREETDRRIERGDREEIEGGGSREGRRIEGGGSRRGAISQVITSRWGTVVCGGETDLERRSRGD
jgi:hypothetical protein